MQAAPARYVSVSELYETDEVELLLDEIRELEPTSCRGEDVQDFEIAGSGCGGGRSPAGTSATERSWDSHAHYRRAAAPRARALAPLYCRPRHLLTARGAARLLLVLCCGAACACVWAALGLRAAPRLRPLLLAALSSVLLHAALLVMHVTRLAALLPLDWPALGAATSAWSALSLAAGGARALHALLAAPDFLAAPAPLRATLLSGAGLALGGAAAAALLTAAGARRAWRARRARGAGAGAYRAVPAAPPAAAAPLPSTSRDDPL